MQISRVRVQLVARILPLFTLVLFAPIIALAQANAGAQSTYIDPSIRASGMGRAGVAVFWGGDANGWVNPALYAYHDGIRYQRGKTKLVPDLSDDVFFTSDQFTIAYGGIGVLIAGKPFDWLGGYELDYGKSIATDIDGNVVGVFSSLEKIQSIGLGFSVAQVLETVGRIVGTKLPPVSRFGDLSLGHTWKSVQVDLAPANVTLDQQAGKGEADQRDHGLLGRLTPYNSIDYPGMLPGLDRSVRLRFDIAYGSSAVNYDNDVTISYIDASQADPIAKDSHYGWAFHLAAALPSQVQERPQGRGLAVTDFLSSLVSFGLTSEHSQYAIHDAKIGTEISENGWELELLRVATLRHGHIKDPAGTIDGDTWGFGVGVDYRGVGGFRYDHAKVPESVFLSNFYRQGFTLYFDPIKLSRLIH